MLASFLKENHKGELILYVSDAGDDYGLRGQILEKIKKTPSDALIILLDMGTTYGPEVEELVKAGRQVIILDHHQLHGRTPDANICAFVNPQRNLEEHVNHHKGKIATAGIVFKLLFAYALSYIQDWKRLYILKLDNLYFIFRCGFCLSSFSKKEGLKSWQKENHLENYETFYLKGEKNEIYEFSQNEWEKMKKDKTFASKLLLFRCLQSRPKLYQFILSLADLSALGTIADIVPLIDENRALVRLGVSIAKTDLKSGNLFFRKYRTGYTALIKALGLKVNSIYSRDIAWLLAPAINAAGRMGNTQLALDLLLCTDVEKANSLAVELVRLNEKRKRRTLKNTKIVKKYLVENQEKLKHPILFCYDPKLESGVSGIIATRLTEEYEKPVVYINNEGDYAKGSIRTWNNFNVLELLNLAAPLFIQFGGHIEAAGFSIDYNNIPKLEKSLYEAYRNLQEKNVEKNNVQKKNLYPYHLELTPKDLHLSLLHELRKLEPFGDSNPEIIIKLNEIEPLRPRYMRDNLHASFQVLGAIPNLTFVAWQKGEQIKNAIENSQHVNIYGCLELNYYRGWEEFQFRVVEIEELKSEKTISKILTPS